jgi:Tfp pilus assembly protein PilV
MRVWRTAGRARQDAGLGLVEVVISMFIFAVISMGVLTSVTKSLALAHDNRARVVAAQLAATELDAVRQLGETTTTYSGIVTTGATTQTVNGITYTIVRSVSAQFADGNGDACSGGVNSREIYRKVSVRVTFPTTAEAQPVRADTIVRTPTVSAGTTTGAIGVPVIDRNGLGVEGVSISVNGTTAQTDENGCAYVPDLPANTYPVTVSKSGYVDPAGSSTPSQSIAVTVGQINKLQFQLDRAASVATRVAVLAADGSEITGYAYPKIGSVTGVTPSLINVKGTRTGSTVSAASTWTVSAFPFSNGYQGRLGACGAVADVVTTPGASVSATLGLAPLDIAVSKQALSAASISGRTVRADSTVPGCSESYTSSVTTAADGTMKLALPYGSWQLSVVNGSQPLFQITPVPVTLGAGAGPVPVALTVNQ